ncbi:MAG: iron ABC transporter permease, partial [Candidatus Bipolaricaulota bacterium]|nr:iron ABC transporter permease [Candidatus Bipolaricaulota bacterium]
MKRTIDLPSSRVARESIIPWRASSAALNIAAALVGALAVIPLVYILIRALEADAAIWERLWSRQIPLLMGNTLALTATTILLSTFF